MLIEMKDVNLVYDVGHDEETYALKNINLNIKENRFYGILGPSGSGKSSLLYLLSGLRKPSSGEVIYKGKAYKDIRGKEMAQIRNKQFGFIFQRHFLMNYLTALENVLVPLNSNKKEDIDKAKELLIKLGLEREINKRPAKMSGGQRQRVAIARALINDPEIIFADEITASLDHKNAFEVMKVLEGFKGKAAILVVTHDESILSGAEEIIRVWDGSIKSVEESRVNAL
ncbi:ABC transporter ATP-binding protein [Clostridium neuense]|uniref:ABC transporter ATP-binding protein n=1 Tax=Clostridium neuense TaxID=1728934 RepID=A0ABW8TE09_9CLOT